MIFRGAAWKFGNDIDTDVIIPVQFTIGTDLEVFGKHCMAGIDPHFSEKVRHGDVIVAGTNFGCGSSREPAPLAIKAAGISCVIAKSYARIFYRNAFNVGLPLLESPEAPDDVEGGDALEVELDSGNIRDLIVDSGMGITDGSKAASRKQNREYKQNITFHNIIYLSSTP